MTHHTTPEQHALLWDIGKRIKRRRRLMGLTQQQLGDLIGIRFQQVQKYETGANRVNVERLPALAKALNVPITYFFPDDTTVYNITLPETSLPLQRLFVAMTDDNKEQLLAIARSMVTLQTKKEAPNASPR